MCLCFCVFSVFNRPFLSPSRSYKPSFYASALMWICSLLCWCCWLNNTVTVTPLLCLSSPHCLAFLLTSSNPVRLCVFFSSSSSLHVPQRRSWIWTKVNGRTFMSSQELWNFSFANFPSPSCPSASSPTSWRQSVSDKPQFILYLLNRPTAFMSYWVTLIWDQSKL